MRTVSLHRLLLGSFLLAEVAVLILLAGCGATFDYDGLRKTEVEGDGFNAALAREYKDFALFETDQMMDWPDAAHFGEKALAAASGAQPLPENPENWRLPAETRVEIAQSRVRLIRVLDRGAGARWPETAARAQVDFDCWIEQQEENWQTDDIARCRNGFHAALDEIDKEFAISEAAADTDIVPTLSPAAAGEPEMRVAEPKRFLILFDFDSARLAPETAPILDAIAEAARRGQDVEVAATGVDDIGIAVAGHADRAGSDSYNLGLSWKRAEAVSAALVERGVTTDRITLAAYGEQDPMVSTDDGVREPRNRRVEVLVGRTSDF